MIPAWSKELGYTATVLLLAWMLGVLTGHILLALLLALGFLCVRQWFHLRAFLDWIGGDTRAAAEGPGIWGEVYYQVQRLGQRAQKREQRLRDVIERFQSSATALPDATIALDAHGAIDWMNKAAADLLGLDTERDIGQRIDNLIRYPAFIRYLRRGWFEEPLEINAPVSEAVRLLVHIVPYGNRQHLLVARDITRLRRLEVMRRDFVANVSHELSTPLTVINGYLEAMDSKAASDADKDEVLARIRRQVERMTHLVNDLLLISRLETGAAYAPRERVDVPALLTSVAADARTLSGTRGHEIVTEVEPGLLLYGSRQELYSAFTNLAANAVRYSPDGGRIELRWYADPRGAHLEVRDQGIGIPPEDLPRITERFYRVDAARSRESGGTGLGLSIVKHVLNRHHAELRVESMPGRGSVFRCDFPSSQVCRAREAEALS